MKSPMKLLALVAALSLSLGSLPASANEPITANPLVEADIAPNDREAIDAYRAALVDFKAAMATYRTSVADFKAQMSAYRLALEEIKPALTQYNLARKTIGRTFAATIATARAAYLAVARDASASPEAKLEAKTTFEQAKATAVASRAEALSELGSAPIKPARPVKPTKPSKPVKPTR